MGVAVFHEEFEGGGVVEGECVLGQEDWVGFAVDGAADAEKVEVVFASVAVDDGSADSGIGVVADEDFIRAEDVGEYSEADFGGYGFGIYGSGKGGGGGVVLHSGRKGLV